MIQKTKEQWVKEMEKIAKYKQNWYVYITLRKYNVKYDHVIHPTPEYKILKQVNTK